jgi:hypothetical protein
MAVMVSFTLKADVQTYQGIHPQMLPVAREAGMIFHTSREMGDEVGIIDIWPSEEAWNNFANGPLAEGMKASGIAPPDDLTVTPLINADAG